jgi:hypothetical protein
LLRCLRELRAAFDALELEMAFSFCDLVALRKNTLAGWLCCNATFAWDVMDVMTFQVCVEPIAWPVCVAN